MKKYFFLFLFLSASVLGSYSFGSELDGLDGGMVIDIDGKNGNTQLTFILPDHYISPNASLVSSLSIRILDEKEQLIYTLETNSFSITLPSALEKGIYTIVIEIGDFWAKESITL